MSIDGLIIRPIRPEDTEDLYHSITHAAVAPYILAMPSMEITETQEWIQKSDRRKPRLVAEVDGRAVGNIGLRGSDNPRYAHSATLGMHVHPDFWGRGIGSALMAAALDVADNWLNLKRVELEVYADNQRAISLYQKFGFELEGTRRMAVYGAGRWADAHVMARIRETEEMRRLHADRRPADGQERVKRQAANSEILIRPFRPEDADDLYDFFYRPAVARSTSQLPYYEIDEARKRFGARQPGLHRLSAVVEGRVVGNVSLFQPQNPRMAHCGDIGLAVHPDYWGIGVGRRLMEAVLDLGDNWLNLRRVQLGVNTDNPIAVRLYEKCGFEIEGTNRYFNFGDGRWTDSYFMARLR